MRVSPSGQRNFLINVVPNAERTLLLMEVFSDNNPQDSYKFNIGLLLISLVYLPPTEKKVKC